MHRRLNQLFTEYQLRSIQRTHDQSHQTLPKLVTRVRFCSPAIIKTFWDKELHHYAAAVAQNVTQNLTPADKRARGAASRYVQIRRAARLRSVR